MRSVLGDRHFGPAVLLEERLINVVFAKSEATR